MTRLELKSLPIAQLTLPYARAGDLTVLAFARSNRHIDALYSRVYDFGRLWRVVKDDPIRAFVVEKHFRAVWSRLVDRSTGYFLSMQGLQRYNE